MARLNRGCLTPNKEEEKYRTWVISSIRLLGKYSHKYPKSSNWGMTQVVSIRGDSRLCGIPMAWYPTCPWPSTTPAQRGACLNIPAKLLAETRSNLPNGLGTAYAIIPTSEMLSKITWPQWDFAMSKKVLGVRELKGMAHDNRAGETTENRASSLPAILSCQTEK